MAIFCEEEQPKHLIFLGHYGQSYGSLESGRVWEPPPTAANQLPAAGCSPFLASPSAAAVSRAPPPPPFPRVDSTSNAPLCTFPTSHGLKTYWTLSQELLPPIVASDVAALISPDIAPIWPKPAQTLLITNHLMAPLQTCKILNLSIYSPILGIQPLCSIS